MSKEYKLSYHGRSVEMCRWVIDTYEHREDCKNNLGVQEWISESKRWLEDNEGSLS